MFSLHLALVLGILVVAFDTVTSYTVLCRFFVERDPPLRGTDAWPNSSTLEKRDAPLPVTGFRAAKRYLLAFLLSSALVRVEIAPCNKFIATLLCIFFK